MAKFRSTIDPSKITDGVRSGAHQGMSEAMLHLETEANKSVPHDEGTLERSSDTGVEDNPNGVTGSVSYDTPYAPKQHEDLALHHDGKGRAKWLELTMAEQRKVMGQIVASRIREALRT